MGIGWKRKLFLALAALVISLGLAEGAARWALRADKDFSAPEDYFARVQRLGQWEAGNWMRELVPHPFFGFTFSREDPRSNNFGFPSPHQILLYEEKNPGDFVIGVFGGSVAMGWADWISSRPLFSEELKKRVPKLKGKTIKILNLSLAGYKQPQQFIVSSYFLDKIDLFLNLDGRNEIESYWSHPLLPLDYPTAAYLFFQEGSSAADSSAGSVFWHSLSRRLSVWGAETSLLRRSALFLLAAKSSTGIAARKAEAIAGTAKERLARELAIPGKGFYDPEAMQDPMQLALRSWTDYTLRQARLLKAFQKKSAFFLQPNQYLPGSKPFSGWEEAHATRARFLERSKAYSLLPPAAARLKKDGVNMHDLTKIFASTNETVYIDDCCHLNDLGNEIMTREIVKGIADSVDF